jgi:peptide/nickel transport system permease protein
LELIDVFDQPYILAAAAKGLPSYRVLWHALRNAVNPLISLTGVTLGGLLSGAVVVEKVFSWPGLGALTVDSILSRDLFVALDCVLISALMVIIANLIADLLLAWNDPQIRYE